MKKGLIVAILLIVVLLFNACQPTPKEPIVQGKASGDNYQENTQGNTQNGNASYSAPSSWKDNLSFYDGKVQIDMDATVNVPAVQTWPVYSVELDGFSQDEVDQYVKVLFGNTTIYQAVMPQTKDELEQLLVLAKQSVADKENDPKSNDNSLENLQAYEKSIEDQIPTAPTTKQEQTATSKMTYNAGYRAPYLYIKGDLGKKKPATLEILSKNENQSDTHLDFRNTNNGGTYDDNYDNTYEPATNKIKYSQQDAINMAKDILNKMGIQGYEYSALRLGLSGVVFGKEQGTTNNADQAYIVYFTKVYNGIPSVFDTKLGGGVAVVAQPDAPPSSYDVIKVAVDNDGISTITWRGREKQTDILENNVQLKPFDEIQKIFENDIKVKYAYTDNSTQSASEAPNFKCKINKISLGYMRIPQKDSTNEFLAVPVWDFFSDGQVVQSGGTPGFDSIITINAIDGTIVDR